MRNRVASTLTCVLLAVWAILGISAASSGIGFTRLSLLCRRWPATRHIGRVPRCSQREMVEVEDALVGFGSFSFLTCGVLAIDEPDYCKRILQVRPGNKKVAYLQDYLRQKGYYEEEVSEHCKLAIGKHKGKTFGRILSKDKEYCSWVMSLPRPGKKIAEFQRFLKQCEMRGKKEKTH